MSEQKDLPSHVREEWIRRTQYLRGQIYGEVDLLSPAVPLEIPLQSGDGWRVKVEKEWVKERGRDMFHIALLNPEGEAVRHEWNFLPAPQERRGHCHVCGKYMVEMDAHAVLTGVCPRCRFTEEEVD